MDADFTPKYNIKAAKDIMVGSGAREYMRTAGLSKKAEAQFFSDVVKFYQKACHYLKANMNPAENPVWKHAQV